MFEIGDWVTVLRDGGLSQSGPMSDYTEDKLITAMVGREVSSLYPDEVRETGTTRLSVRGLRRTKDSPAVDFDARAGEILGIGGLLGSGRSELLLAIFGSEPIVEGEIKIDGETVKPDGPRSMMSAGVALLTEDRKVLGLLPELSIRENVTVASLRNGSRKGLLPGKQQAAEADKLLDSLRLRAGSYDQPVSTLSGGNQQKVLLARWLLTKPKVIMFDEPTKGIDVGAKGELYDVINELARQGLAVIVVSSYLPELLGLSDRVLVLHDEEIAGELPGGARRTTCCGWPAEVCWNQPSRITSTESHLLSTIPTSTPSSDRTSKRRRSPMPKLIWREPIETTVITSRARRRHSRVGRGRGRAIRRWGSPQGGDACSAAKPRPYPGRHRGPRKRRARRVTRRHRRPDTGQQ